ncbi:MAG: lysoplasmalogenase family protein, partial [Anaerolineae bacterium]
MLAFQLLTAVMLAALLVAERLDSQRGKWLGKPLASAGFVGAALMAGAWHGAYGRLVLLALLLCWLGDVLLIPAGNDRVFRAGIASFLLGHIAFAAAFVVRGASPVQALLALAVLALPAAVVTRWLRRWLP